MKNKTSIFLLFILIACGLSLNSCSNDTAATGQTPETSFGSLKIIMNGSGGTATRSITPDFNIASYTIHGVGPNQETFTVNGTENSANIDDLRVGSWALSIIALNSDQQVIGKGDATAVVSSYNTTDVDVTITRKEGNGIFVMSVSWDAGNVETPSVTGELLEDPSIALSFNLGDDMLSASCSTSDIPAGDYTLKVTFYDGDLIIWSDITSITVLADETVSGGIVITADSINPAVGSISMTSQAQLNLPIEITFSGTKPSIPKGTALDIFSSTNTSVNSRQWFLNGNAITGETYNTITIGSDLNEGSYNLALQVKKGSITTVKSIHFKVGPPAPIIEIYNDLNLLESGASEFDFGTLLQYDYYPNAYFRINNMGTADLDISSIVIEGENSEQFSQIQANVPPVTIAPNGFYTFVIQFAPDILGENNATVRISHNDPGCEDFTFDLTGTIVTE